MDAMRRLEAIGIVQIVPQSGCRVAALHHPGDPRLLQPVRPLRGRDRRRGRLPAYRRAAGRARPAWQRIADLETSHDTTARSRGYRFLNREFHLVIHQMAHSRVMAELSERMWDMSDFFINTIGGAQHLSDALTRPQPRPRRHPQLHPVPQRRGRTRRHAVAHRRDRRALPRRPRRTPPEAQTRRSTPSQPGLDSPSWARRWRSSTASPSTGDHAHLRRPAAAAPGCPRPPCTGCSVTCSAARLLDRVDGRLPALQARLRARHASLGRTDPARGRDCRSSRTSTNAPTRPSTSVSAKETRSLYIAKVGGHQQAEVALADRRPDAAARHRDRQGPARPRPRQRP